MASGPHPPVALGGAGSGGTWGLGPREVANQLVACFRAEVDFLRVLGGWTARVDENDERLAFARDLGLRAEHGQALLDRLHRLRTTDRMIAVPTPRVAGARRARRRRPDHG